MPVVASAGDSTDTARGVPRTARPRNQLPLPQAAVPSPGLQSASRYPSSLPGWSRAPASQGIGSSQWAPPSCARWRPPRDQTAASGQLAARIITGLVTGLHVPEASHLLLLEAVAGAELVGAAYAPAVERRYLWHEVGDSTLFLPDLA